MRFLRDPRSRLMVPDRRLCMSAPHQALLMGGGGGGGTDPDWASVVLSCPFQGTNGATTTTDVSSYAHTLTAVGDAVISTAEGYGGSSSFFMSTAGAESYWSVADAAELDMDAGVFTVEWYMKFSGTGGGGFGTCYSKNVNASDGIALGYLGGSIALRASGTNDLNVSVSPSAGTNWAHVAWVKDASDVRRVYVGGVQQGSSTLSFTQTNTSVLKIGRIANTAFSFSGYAAHLRVTKGVCRYPGGTTFTPPSAPYPTS
jgi:hypothetical protein